MNFRLCECVAFLTVFTIASSGDPSPSNTSDGMVKFQWFSPILVDETELKQEDVSNIHNIVWQHFQQILYWLQQPEEKIQINQRIPQPNEVFLRQDLAVAYEMKCMKATTEPHIFDNATLELSSCLETYLQNGNVDDVQSIIDAACRYPSVPINCMDMYKMKLSHCLNADEIETLNSVQRVMEKILTLNCEDSGSYFVSLMAGEGNQCIRAQIGSMKKCSKDFKHVFPMQDDTIRFKLTIGSRNQLQEKSRCILAALDNCRDSTARNFYASLFKIIYDETDFTVSIWGVMFLCFIFCVALSFFVCVLCIGKSTEPSEPTEHTEPTELTESVKMI